MAFRPQGSGVWSQAVLASPDASRYVYWNDSVAPLSRYEVKVGVYNAVGEGPFSPMVTVLSAEDGQYCFSLTYTSLVLPDAPGAQS